MRWPRLRPECPGESPHLASPPGRVKLSPKLQPPTIRNAGGQVPGIRFCPKRKKKRQRRKASEARQARRAPPCGQGSAGMGACGQLVRVVHMYPCRAFLSIRPRPGTSRHRVLGWGSGGGSQPPAWWVGTWGRKAWPWPDLRPRVLSFMMVVRCLSALSSPRLLPLTQIAAWC